MLLPQLGWGLVSPDEGLLQPGWLWFLAAGLCVWCSWPWLNDSLGDCTAEFCFVCCRQTCRLGESCLPAVFSRGW